MRQLLFGFLLLMTPFMAQGQTVLGFQEYMNYVKKYHPVAQQADLNIEMGNAKLLKARGGFDPKIEVDYNGKRFKNTEYFDLLSTRLKVPTWYGLEFKAGFEQNDGVYLNPENNVPDAGLFNAGLSLPLLQGLLINERMATLNQAKIFQEQTQADRDVLVNQVLYEAALAYFNWLKTYNETLIYRNFLVNATTRFEGIKRSALAGDKAAIDTLEARIVVQNRNLNLEQSKVKLMKSGLELSNFLWLENNTPVVLQAQVIPDLEVEGDIDLVLELLQQSIDNFSLDQHPKLRSLKFKMEGLEVERKLKANKLLPRLDIEYNFLTANPGQLDTYQTAAYKGGLRFRIPLFLRKERGDLQLAKFKIQDTQLEWRATQLTIQNKVRAIYQELESYETQNQLIATIVTDYRTLLTAEERKFFVGESALFLINSRESKLIDAQLKQNELQNKYFNAKAKLFNSLALNPRN